VGFWLIDDKGVKQPIYNTYAQYYKNARKYVGDFIQANGKPPSDEEFRKVAVGFLNK
jgi:hypothetical protein